MQIFYIQTPLCKDRGVRFKRDVAQNASAQDLGCGHKDLPLGAFNIDLHEIAVLNPQLCEQISQRVRWY